MPEQTPAAGRQHPEQSDAKPPRVFFYGSCVSRDLGRIAGERLSVGPYVARQSCISAFSRATAEPDQASKLTSNFQRRMVAADFASSLVSRLEAEADDIDILLMDLVDERLGVVPTASGFITNSYELRNSGWKRLVATGDVLELGTPAHFRRWRRSFKKLKRQLVRLGLFEKSVLIRSTYATHSVQGDDLAATMRKSPDEWNRLFLPYFRFVEKLGFQLIAAPQEVTVADRDHMWGLAAFHYADAYYQALADRVLDVHRRVASSLT